MLDNNLKLSRLIKSTASQSKEKFHSMIWIQREINDFQIDDKQYDCEIDSVYFINKKYSWNMSIEENSTSKGYVLKLTDEILSLPSFSKLFITQVNIFNDDSIPVIQFSPGIAVRIEAILEMIDELMGSQLDNKDEGILSLLNAFFIYCDGQCNIKSVLGENRNQKTKIVYDYKKLINDNISTWNEVKDYAYQLNISEKYLNECVKEVLTVNAKQLIIEKLLMSSRRALKFSDSSIKEISFDLGFSSPDYFSSFFKKYTGTTPTGFRNT
jgi:AraC-like DNA-binding protein